MTERRTRCEDHGGYGGAIASRARLLVGLSAPWSGLLALALVAGCLSVLPAEAADTPHPRDKPAEDAVVNPPALPEAALVETAAEKPSGKPAEKPRDKPLPLGSAAPTPEPAPEAEATRPEAASSCLGDLRARGAKVVARPDAVTQARCGVEEPVELSAMGAVLFDPAPILACDTARKVADFVSGTLSELASKHYGTGISTIRVAGAYECRGRNRQPGAQLSEHAFGRALDMRGVTLADGGNFSVLPRADKDMTVDARFQRAVRKAACGPFTTVLGPGSDAYHDDHMHFDTKPRRSPYCR